jgi:CRP-like cAMP-binding protein
MTFTQYLATIIHVSPALQAHIESITRRRTVEKWRYLLRAGECCTDITFVETGLVRGFWIDGDKEITTWMAIDGQFASSFLSFVTRTPSTESIVAIEPSVVVQLSYNDVQQLYLRFPETERMGRLITENYYIRLDSRFQGIQFKTARERYQQLLDTNPVLVQRAPLGYIASWLGITQETLSRIRGKY